MQDAPRASEPATLSGIAQKVGCKNENSLRDHDLEACRAISKRYRTATKTHRRRGSQNRRTQMEQALRKALWQDPPPNIRDVSLALGLPYSTFRNRFPALCHELVARARKYRKLCLRQLEKALRTALTEEPPPTVKELAARMGHCTGKMLQIWFPDLYQALAARAAQRHDWWMNSRRSLLEAALTEEPPPSGKSVAGRIGIDSGYARVLFPDTWRQVVARYSEYRKREAARDREALREEVRTIARDTASDSA